MVGEVCGFLEEGPCWPRFFFPHVFFCFFFLAKFHEVSQSRWIGVWHVMILVSLNWRFLEVSANMHSIREKQQQVNDCIWLHMIAILKMWVRPASILIFHSEQYRWWVFSSLLYYFRCSLSTPLSVLHSAHTQFASNWRTVGILHNLFNSCYPWSMGAVEVCYIKCDQNVFRTGQVFPLPQLKANCKKVSRSCIWMQMPLLQWNTMAPSWPGEVKSILGRKKLDFFCKKSNPKPGNQSLYNWYTVFILYIYTHYTLYLYMMPLPSHCWSWSKSPSQEADFYSVWCKRVKLP